MYSSFAWITRSEKLSFDLLRALVSLVAPPHRRRRTAAPSLPSSGNDSDLPSQPAVLHSVPSSHASERTISATIPAFPPALLDQLVQHVAAEVTRQFQPASFPPAIQESQVPFPTTEVFPNVAGTTAVQQLTTEVPVVGSSPVGNTSAGEQVAQVVQSLHSSLTEGKYQLTINPGDGSWVQAFHVFVGVFTSRSPSEGFPLYFDGPRCSQEAPNLLSALQNPKAVSAKLSKELDAHRLAGPFSSPPFPIFRISPLGLVPKKVEAKTDVKSAFRLVPIRPEDYDLLGIYWEGQYYYGSFLGIPMAPEKTVGSSTTLAFAGIELDTVLMEARLPQEKLDKCRDLPSAFLGRRKLSKEVKEDLLVWQSFVSAFNGRSFFLADRWTNSHQLELYADASGALGYGAVLGTHWCYGQWPHSWHHFNIAVLELYPIILILHLWGHDVQNQKILFFTDNEALVHVINKQSSRDKNMMFFVRRLVLVRLEKNICFEAKHIPGVHNVLADALSRLKLQTFKQLAPAYMNVHPTEIPYHLLPHSWHQ
ncbi:hypothetical protein AWC38_SpisGene7982 [Stylophora pistillata]|uniref:Reverse transcriptase RNase H-like domain-containing protein n=1 Tax=Stylophora pistillata TaxID=50429 RepID=A0A2B4SFI8_STYPI|nr:hypothetical protein AWC38_SpisGene7982 [Stylophora pistillata]